MNWHFVPPPHGFVGVSGSALPFYLSTEKAGDTREDATSPEETREDAMTTEESTRNWLELWDNPAPATRSLEEEIVGVGLLSGIQLAEAYSHHFLVPVFDPDPTRPLPIDPAVANLLPHQFCSENSIVPLADDGTTIDIAIVSPEGLMLREEIRRISQRTMRAFFATKEVVLRAFQEIYDCKGGPQSVEPSEFLESPAIGPSYCESIDVESVRDSSAGTNSRNLAVEFLKSAVRRRATEASIETFGGECQVRLRIEGKLCSWVPTNPNGPNTIADGGELIASLLNMAGAMGAEYKNHQRFTPDDLLRRFGADGHPQGSIRIRHGRRRLAVELEAFRTIAGLKLISRFQSREAAPRKLAELGMLPEQEEWTRNLLGSGNGLFLVFGAPRSGKRTTLYALMDYLNQPEHSLVAVEESVRVIQPGISQFSTTATKGLDREQLIRRALRQAPDVLMVDRIENQCVATACIDAVHQGLLVLASFDATDWETALDRLKGFGLASEGRRTVVAGLLGQRLVPRICRECRYLQRDLFGEGKGTQWIARGCVQCGHTGYRGRLAVFDHQPHWFESDTLQAHSSGVTPWNAAVRRHREGLIDWETLQNSFPSRAVIH